MGIAGVDIAITNLQTQLDELGGGLYDGAAQINIISNGGLLIAKSGDPNAAGKPFQEISSGKWNEINTIIQQGKSTLEDNNHEIQLFAPMSRLRFYCSPPCDFRACGHTSPFEFVVLAF